MHTRLAAKPILLIAALLLSACQGAAPQADTPAPPAPTTASAASETAQETGPYVWRGVSLSLAVPLPSGPETAGVFSLSASLPATLETAEALAARLGMQPAWYADGDAWLGVDGNQRLLVRSSGEFRYTPGPYNFWVSAAARSQPADAAEQITAFLQTFDTASDFALDYSETYAGYFVLPLLPGGFPLRHESFAANGLLFNFLGAELAAVEGRLISYESLGEYEIISAAEALDRALAPTPWYGVLDYFHGMPAPEDAWLRSYPQDERISVFGWMTALPATQGGAPLVSLDGYRVLGNLEGIAEPLPLTSVEATGRFETQAGEVVFVLESWQPRDGEGILGDLQQDGDSVVLLSTDGRRLQMPAVPEDVPLPLENVYVMGVTVGEAFEWNTFDLRMHGNAGGGGGGLGLFGLNLSRTPQELPEPDPAAQSPGEPDPQAPTALVEVVELVYFTPRFGAGGPQYA